MNERSRPRLYVLGPFRAPTEFERRQNITRAEEAALMLVELGAFYRCPHLHSAHFDGQGDDAYWLELGIDLLSECDAAYLVPDREPGVRSGYKRRYLCPEDRTRSRGSIAEVGWCEAQHIPVLATLGEVINFIAGWHAGRERLPFPCNSCSRQAHYPTCDGCTSDEDGGRQP